MMKGLGSVSAEGRRSILSRWLLAALSACALTAIAGQAQTAEGRQLVTGIGGIDDYDSHALRQVKATGASMIHIGVQWADVAPRKIPSSWDPQNPADPHYEWSSTDIAVIRAVRGGLTPVLAIYGAPSWVQRCKSVIPPGRLCDPEPAALAAFAVAAASRYSGYFAGLPHVRYWQGLNEPNLSLFFNPQFSDGKPVSAELYRTLVNTFYAAVKSVSHSNLVLVAGLGPIAVPQWTIGPMQFARELLCMRGRRHPHPSGNKCHSGVHFDIFDIHPYTTGGPTHKGHINDVELGDLLKLQELIQAADRVGRIKGRFQHTPLWITEFSWDSKPPDPGGVPMRILKRWTAETLYRSWRAKVSRFFWYGLRDHAPDPSRSSSETIESGLYFRGATVAKDKPKPSMYAFRFPFVAYSRKSGFFFWGRTPNSKGGKVVIQIRKGGGWRNAMIARADKNGIFKGVAKGTYGRHKRGTVRARYRGESAVPFSLHPVKDFYQPPFG